MGRLEVVEHEVYGIRGCADEDDLEDGVVQRMRVVEGPEKVDVSTKVNNQVQELRLEGDTGRALFGLSGFAYFCLESIGRTLEVFILCKRMRIDSRWDRSPKNPC